MKLPTDDELVQVVHRALREAFPTGNAYSVPVERVTNRALWLAGFRAAIEELDSYDGELEASYYLEQELAAATAPAPEGAERPDG